MITYQLDKADFEAINTALPSDYSFGYKEFISVDVDNDDTYEYYCDQDQLDRLTLKGNESGKFFFYQVLLDSIGTTNLMSVVLNIVDISIEQVKDSYAPHNLAGIEYFEQLRGELAFEFILGQRSLVSCKNVEEGLDNVKGKIMSGDWLTSSIAITEVVVTEDLTQEIIDRVALDIGTYISENY